MGQLDRQIAATIRSDYGRVLAALIAYLRDFSLAEDALGDALLRAAEHWPNAGLPNVPAAWLLTVAKRAALDRLRKGKVRAAPLARATLAILAQEDVAMTDDNDTIPDERLRLIFTCCHPALAAEAQIALTLKTLCGLSARDIAQAFLVQETTMLARLTRAKSKIAAAGIPFRLPESADLAVRRDSVLSVIYLIYTAAHGGYEGDAATRTDLAHEALHLAEMLFDLMPDPEVEGLLALLHLHEARRAARHDQSGAMISLRDQDRTRWDKARIDKGKVHLLHALGKRHPGPFQIQAAISALHAEAVDFTSTDWVQIAGLYRALSDHTPSPIVTLNHAAAVALGGQPEQGLAMMMPLLAELQNYQPYFATRADIYRQLGQRKEALADYDRAIELSQSAAERDWLAAQRRALMN